MNDFRDWERDREAKERGKPHLRLRVRWVPVVTRLGVGKNMQWRVEDDKNSTSWYALSGLAIHAWRQGATWPVHCTPHNTWNGW